MYNKKSYLYIFLVISLIAVFINMIYVSGQNSDSNNKDVGLECLNLLNIVSMVLLGVGLYVVSKFENEVDPNLIIKHKSGNPLIDEKGKPITVVIDEKGNPILNKEGKPYPAILDKNGKVIKDSMGKPYEQLFDENGKAIPPFLDNNGKPELTSEGYVMFDSKGQDLYNSEGIKVVNKKIKNNKEIESDVSEESSSDGDYSSDDSDDSD